MRTPALKKLDGLISDLNTHFALSNFFAEQFRFSNASLLADEDRHDELTATAFPESHGAKRINIPIGKITTQIEDFETYLLSQSIARCSEGVITYFEWIEAFSLFAFGRTRDADGDFFASICRQFATEKKELLPNECYWTFDHLRKRRNCLIHNNDESTETFEQNCRQHGTILNRYWTDRLGHKCRVNYTNKAPSEITPDAFIDLINCIRLATESFDVMYCQKIPDQKRKDYTLEQFESKFKNEKLSKDRKAKKINGFSQWLFGVNYS